MKRAAARGTKPAPSAAKRAEPDYARDHPALVLDRKAELDAHLERQFRVPFHKRSVATQLTVFVVVLIVWQIPVVNPIKLLVVLFHEMSHVAVAYLTGGRVFGIAIDPGGAGVTLGIGGNETLIVLAGYLGSLTLGCALYGLIALRRPAEVWACLTAVSCASLTLGWLNDFTAAFGIGTVALLVAGILFFKDNVKKFLLTVTATTSCLYPIIDLAGEYIRSENTGFIVHGRAASSDISQLAQLTGISAGLLATVFCLTGMLIVVYLIDLTARLDAEMQTRRQTRFFPVTGPPRRRKVFTDELYDPGDPSSGREYVLR
ncbi:M50 family metallopeptidase [Candidatus Sumerlaeota bacterium]|nr:M50 family metallopeptidase [Candidatus Sumerlaeota bacterium]